MRILGRNVRLKPPITSNKYRASYSNLNLPAELPAATVWSLRVRVLNQTDWVWLRRHPEGKNVDLTVWIDGRLAATQAMPVDELHPGEAADFRFALQIPAGNGSVDIVLDMIEQNVTRFCDQGGAPCKVRVKLFVAPVSVGAALQEKANRLCPWSYQPTGGLQLGAYGAQYPLFVERAVGCHFWDTENRCYIDYVMGWGCALLGYAEPRIQEAVCQVLGSGSVVPLPHRLEVEVAEMVSEDIPSAERIIFGKNGSDVCTVAARIARVYTGRRVILYCGYHGWQDWWVEQVGFANCGVPDRDSPLLIRFKFNNREDFLRLYELHHRDLAAIMLEPSGPAEGLQGDPQDADSAFLKLLSTSARDAGALLIFDEIMTGFRYPGGSVQAATGVIPDLTCLGKALGAGMPISALAGNAAIMESAMHRTHYGPTFKGEIYSLAAARAALTIYRNEPVAQHVTEHGTKLRDGINRLCSELGMNARCVGPAFRTTLVFDDDGIPRVRMKRTLYFQELLKLGIMTYNGFMLPSYAHGDSVLSSLLECVGAALEIVRNADQRGTLDQLIEIPLL
ncbi:Glutamate-1-semialdehyde aminotransferase [Burkholderia sp. YR290]|nr:Glutamate-1-semialdehyde aminotransferase [Burkholderia sp. YR290]